MQLPARYVWLCLLALAGIGAFAAGAQTAEHPRLMAQTASGEVIACAWSPDGRSVLTGGREGMARLWDAATGAELKSFQGEAWISYAAFSTDHQRVVTVSSRDEKTTVQLWDVTTGKELGRISPPAGKLIFGMASRDGSTVATASEAETGEQGDKLPAIGATRIQLWNLLTAKEISHFLVPGAPVTGMLQLSPDGSKLFTGDFDGPRLWDVGTGKLLRQFPKPDGVVNAVVFSADGRSLAWGTIPGTVRMWDVETGKEIQHFAGNDQTDYMAVVNSVAISQDGRRLLTGSNEGSARLWDVETGKDLQRFAASDKGTNTSADCSALSPDGRTVGRGNRQGASPARGGRRPGSRPCFRKRRARNRGSGRSRHGMAVGCRERQGAAATPANLAVRGGFHQRRQLHHNRGPYAGRPAGVHEFVARRPGSMGCGDRQGTPAFRFAS